MDGMPKTVSHKKLYEMAISKVSSEETKREAILGILRLALTDPSHFTFLLNQINWFSSSYQPLLPLLVKIIRLYRGMCREAPKVAYNMLTEGLTISHLNLIIVDLLTMTLENTTDHGILMDCIRENYPHKVCPVEYHLSYLNSLLKLSEKLPNLRFDLLEIIIQNLAYFDTEMQLGEEMACQFEVEDFKYLALRNNCGDLEKKYDQILSCLLNYLANLNQPTHAQVLKEMFIIFQKLIMIVENTKMIQLVMFLLAETFPENSLTFLTLLLATTLENYNRDGSKRKLQSALQYLVSYICRSNVLGVKIVKKIVSTLIKEFKEKVKVKENYKFDELKIVEFANKNQAHLELFNAILLILANFPKLKQSLSQWQTTKQLAVQKLHLTLFIDKSLLHFHGINQTTKLSKKHWTIPIVHRFMPVFLSKTSQYIDMKVDEGCKRMRGSDKELGGSQPKKRIKIHGDQTPVTIGEFQI